MESKGFVQIPIDEYNNLMEQKRTLDTLLKSDRCVEVSAIYSYDTGGPVYIVNPTASVKDTIDKLIKEKNQSLQTYFDWGRRDKNKKIKFRHIGKTIQQVIDDK